MCRHARRGKCVPAAAAAGVTIGPHRLQPRRRVRRDLDAVLIGLALVIVGVPLALSLAVLTWLAAFFPILVLLAVVAGGTLAGPAGAFLAVPVATVCATALELGQEQKR